MHAIHHLEFTSRKGAKTIQKECARIADANGDYKGQVSAIRFVDRVLKNRDEAEKWIEQNDRGWYDNLAIKFKDGGRVTWLVKIEYHC